MFGHPGRCGALEILRHFQWGLACLLAAAAIATPSGPARAGPQDPAPADDQSRKPADPAPPSLFVILNSPADLNALLEKVRRPDLELRRVDPATPASAGAGGGAGAGAAASTPRTAAAPGIVESVRIRGRVRGDSAALTVEMAILTAADDPTWVPIRLDGQRLIDARQGARMLDVRRAESRRWEVELVGRGRHLIEVELRCPVATRPARASLELAIPEAPSTSLELDFDRNPPDLVVGGDEVFGAAERSDGQGWRLSARLSPRSRLDVSWADGAEAGGGTSVLTAQGDIAIEIDPEQMRTRSSWVIRGVKGMTRTLEVGLADDDDVTEVRLDDQPAESGIEGGRGAARLAIPLAEPLRPGAERRLTLKTRRPHGRGPQQRIAFRGFPIAGAREQTGAIGVTQSVDLWVAPASARGLRRIVPTFLPKGLAERPGTSLAFEFLEPSFDLALDVEASPPLVRSRSTTRFRIVGDRARSQTSVELQWVRGRPFELALELGPGLDVVSVGPPSVVEACTPTGGPPGRAAAGGDGPRGLSIRLAPPVRDQSSVTIRLEGTQRLPKEGPVKLGLFAPDETTSVGASFSITGDRGLSVELDPEAARSEQPGGAGFRVVEGGADLLASAVTGEPGRPALAVDAGGSPRALPVRIIRHARSVHEETRLSASISAGAIELRQATTFTVRHGTLGMLEVRVPPGLVDGWEPIDREVIEREELSREPDGSRVYRLLLDHPLADRATLGFRYRLPIRPRLDSAGERDLTIPWLTFPQAVASPARVELTMGTGVLFRGGGSDWTPVSDSDAPGSGGDAAGLAFVAPAADPGRPFRLKAMALEPAALPDLLVPRRLIKSTAGLDGAVRHRAWHWVEMHGAAFPFALPEGARFIAARVGGRTADRVDFELERSGYRVWLPADTAGQPVLVELEYQVASSAGWSRWQAPRLLDGGEILQTLWEVWLPSNRVVVGVPHGWSDENVWSWSGGQWVRRPVRDGAALNDWLLGDGAPAAAVEDLRESTLDDSQHLLFGQACTPGASDSEPAALGVWMLPRAWLIAVCSGGALLVGFLAIFARIRFRTAWAAAAVALLVAAFLHPSIAAQLAQSASLGAALTALGLVIQHLLDRRRARSLPTRDSSSLLAPAPADSAVDRGPIVGSDDPTAIRVRTPSTLDYVPAHSAGTTEDVEAGSSTFGRV